MYKHVQHFIAAQTQQKIDTDPLPVLTDLVDVHLLVVLLEFRHLLDNSGMNAKVKDLVVRSASRDDYRGC